MPTFSGLTTFLLSLFLAIFSLTLVCGDYLYYTCDDNEGSVDYLTNLGMVSATIYSQAASFGYGFKRVNGVHGSLLCRGDVHPEDCEFCFAQASQTLRDVCYERLGAFGYSEYCYFIYNYKDRDWDANVYYCSAGNIVPNDPTWFSDVLWDVFHQISLNAATDAKYMSALYVDLGNSNTLYAYGQCHNEIAAAYCQSCLGRLKALLASSDSCTNGFVGGRLVAGSCTIRYELYPFLDA